MFRNVLYRNSCNQGSKKTRKSDNKVVETDGTIRSSLTCVRKKVRNANDKGEGPFEQGNMCVYRIRK